MDTYFYSRSGKKITIRPPKHSDTHQMLGYINELGREDIYLNASPDNLFTFSQEDQYVRDCLYKIDHRLQIHLLAFFNDILIGSVTISKQFMRKTHIGLFGITIAKAYRGDGIGHALAQIALEKTIEIDIKLVVLSVFAKNEPAINLYQKLGFHQYGLLPSGFTYQGNFEDEIVMYKTI